MGRKPTNDPNLFAKRVFDKLLDKLDPESAKLSEREVKDKDSKAVAAGRKGGRKGGKIRAKTLTAEQRRDIAETAAAARWKKRD